MLKLLASMFRRFVTAVTNPFRMLIVRVQRMFNINIITAKLISPLTKHVRKLITLRPQTREDYFVIGRWWVYKKLFLTLTLAICAGVFLYFSMFSPKLPATMAAAAVKTDITFDYNDMALREFSGVANIRAADGVVVFTGDIAAGVCAGNGTLWDREGRLLYEGGFDQNRYSGKGSSYYLDGSLKYEGDWASGAYHGQGALFAADGTPIYTGSFADGLYEGTGKAYSPTGTLLYEGDFSAGLYHGSGVSYYSDGVTRYKGDFYRGVAQGTGQLFAASGKLLYTGDMYDGRISYRSLLGSTYADIQSAFAETPRIFYTDTDSAFAFEQAGVVITVDCRVLVDTWERPADPADDRIYYMPGEAAGAGGQSTPPGPVESAPRDVVVEAGGGWMVVSSGRSAKRTPAVLQPAAWYVAEDEQGAYNPPGSSSSTPSIPFNPPEQSSSSDAGVPPPESSPGSGVFSPPEESSPSSDNVPPPSGSLPGDLPESGVYGPQESSPAAEVHEGAGRPDFIEREHTVYFEIDADIWQSEAELDASKVRIKKVTVFTSDFPDVPAEAVRFDDDAPIFLEDCVAIDFIRQRLPTAYPHVMFEADLRNRLFVRLWNISFAQRIERKVYILDDLIYRYSYQDSETEAPLYFSLEK